MLIARRNGMAGRKAGPSTLYRYVKLRYVKRHGDEVVKNCAWRISRLEFVDARGNGFPWPDGLAVDVTTGDFAPSNPYQNMFNHGLADYAWWRYARLPAELVVDLGAPLVDPSVYTRWQWWQGGGVQKYADQLPAEFSLSLSEDGESWFLADYKAGWDGPVQNYGLGYEGPVAV